MSYTQVTPDHQPALSRRIGPLAGAVIGALVLVIVAVTAYAAGSRHGHRLTTLTGKAYVGDHQASVKVDGWVYGIVGSVAWVDESGTSHDASWPACLRTPGTTVRIKFGEITVTGPQNDWWREVAWVDCRGAVRVH